MIQLAYSPQIIAAVEKRTGMLWDDEVHQAFLYRMWETTRAHVLQQLDNAEGGEIAHLGPDALNFEVARRMVSALIALSDFHQGVALGYSYNEFTRASLLYRNWPVRFADLDPHAARKAELEELIERYTFELDELNDRG